MIVQTSRASRRRRQEGVVVVEGLIVSAALVCLFGCILVVHLYCQRQLEALDEAREAAWADAMRGCGSDEPVLKDMALEIIAGEFPFPDGLMPSIREAQRTVSVTGIFDATGRKEMKFVCNPQPGKEKPMSDLVGWVFELFS